MYEQLSAGAFAGRVSRDSRTRSRDEREKIMLAFRDGKKTYLCDDVIEVGIDVATPL